MLRYNEPRPGDVVVFRFPEDETKRFIKRVIGVPGDRVHYDNGNLYINEQRIAKKTSSRPESLAGSGRQSLALSQVCLSSF